MRAFDAPSREERCAERTRSNIPHQALALITDLENRGMLDSTLIVSLIRLWSSTGSRRGLPRQGAIDVGRYDWHDLTARRRGM